MKNKYNLKLIITFILMLLYLTFSFYMQFSYIPKTIETFEFNYFLVVYNFFDLPILVTFVTVISLLIILKNFNNYTTNKHLNIIFIISIFIIYILFVFFAIKVPLLNFIIFNKIQYIQLLLFIPFGICIYKVII